MPAANSFLVSSSRSLQEQKSVSKIQEEVLRRFRSNDVNLLVATDILKEGIHVPKCNVIVMFSLPMNFNTFIQSKGRARAPKLVTD